MILVGEGIEFKGKLLREFYGFVFIVKMKRCVGYES